MRQGQIPGNQYPRQNNYYISTTAIGSYNEKDYHNKQAIPRRAKKRKSQDFTVSC